MAGIKNIEGLTTDQINRELAHGAKFVVFQFTISVLVMTFRRSSDIYFIRSGESRLIKGLPFTLMTFLLGWWGIPWGPIYSIGSLVHNLNGGKDVTQEILNSYNNQESQTATG
ncbi:hypothetical protein SAMN05660236_3781 [Ohtaekwangia koreensis]|uniref:Uncharacterized protein n=1 Tax=Ohtaekwangia koreensis TaxID=688867 RepID=A0A1T5LRI0_9BACT|nr:hypothetical protein SAMN05660236_3781 [Ohtaekwangia koreensis]